VILQPGYKAIMHHQLFYILLVKFCERRLDVS